VDPVPDPLLLRKSGSPGNRTRTTRPQRRSASFYITYINSVRTSQEAQYISDLWPRTLITRPQRRSIKGNTPSIWPTAQ
jgi:hypothetical protein